MFPSEYIERTLEAQTQIMLHPIGFMNMMGKNVKAAVKPLAVRAENSSIVVIHDDLE